MTKEILHKVPTGNKRDYSWELRINPDSWFAFKSYFHKKYSTHTHTHTHTQARVYQFLQARQNVC